MHWELIHEESREGFDIQFFAAPEEDDPRDHFDDDGETAQAIRDGRYDWFVAKVTASRAGVELGEDYLGGCCYETARDFVRPGDYYDDMVAQAIEQAREKLSDLLVSTVTDDLERSYGPVQAAAMSVCESCGAQVPYIIGAPDGSEVCQHCFDGGAA